MRVNQPDVEDNVIPFRQRARDDRHHVDDARSDNILRLLDLSKFEQHRRTVDRDATMRSNIAAIILLGLLVFVASEDFYRLEQSNLCPHTFECGN